MFANGAAGEDGVNAPTGDERTADSSRAKALEVATQDLGVASHMERRTSAQQIGGQHELGEPIRKPSSLIARCRPAD